MPRRLITGVVTRDGASKTRRVEIERLVQHRTYRKYIRRRTICYAHDEDNVSRNGDLVEIEESRPISKLKRWRLVRVIKQHVAGVPLPDSDSGLITEAASETSAE